MSRNYFTPTASSKRRKRGGRQCFDHLYVARGLSAENTDFECKHCHNHVSAAPFISGVQNRNHCPYCLWSKHVDMYKAGDRLSACKQGMKPVGLTLKRTRDKYAGAWSGELMLIHRCSDCGHISINRIAADDDPETILGVYSASLAADDQLSAMLAANGIYALAAEDAEIVRARLYGWE